MGLPLLVVTFDLDEAGRSAVAAELGGGAEAVYLPRLDGVSRRDALRNATAVLARNTGKELRGDEPALIGGARLVQFMSAGVDFIPLRDLPVAVPVAGNGGAYAEPMAEHAAAMALAAAKRLLPEHAALARGEFNQFKRNRMLAGGICGILGFGGIGVATARLMRCLGMRVHAIRRSVSTDAPVDWLGTPDRLDELLAAADVLVVSLPLTRATRNLIGARELTLMKTDAILVNLARGEILDERALYEHLRATPGFTACLDAWWVEPVRHGEFRMDHPFLELPNVIGSPHNSASVGVWREVALRRAVTNCRRALEGLRPLHLIGDDERAAAPP
ncbi:MAG: D-3-phosphoglycerate dehydrogenase [uncultured Acetobacteraceae bacterium]|uniref:D-3-phosphoglycerate dehydrogenase n=1 Tax=uncultured Acetobacteraceae bacterium TaxID=169975 RepID=A0A6J4H9L3_9PROT|nr:MAG: D-3-phosphoglycerate dehydrogenase [uncultured Acetobacteraceae bacterium]